MDLYVDKKIEGKPMDKPSNSVIVPHAELLEKIPERNCSFWEKEIAEPWSVS